jgi:hypothetical protein
MFLMLTDADQDESSRETPADAAALFSKLKKWIKTDYNSKGQVN